MVKTTLVEPLILDGAAILRELDVRGFPVECMFWLDLPDRDHWRLVIASSVATAEGRDGYSELGAILRDMPMELAGVTLSDISLLDPKSQQFEEYLSAAVASGRLAAEKSWDRYGGAVIYRWTGDFVRGIVKCGVSLQELESAWNEYRRSVNEPALLIELNQRRVTLRFHPRHYKLSGVEKVKQPFMMGLQQKRPDCNIAWE